MYKNYKIGWSNYDKKRWFKLERLLVRDLFTEWKRIDGISIWTLSITEIFSYLRNFFFVKKCINSMTRFQADYFDYLNKYERNYR